MAEYDFELHHRPGDTNTVPDALSRYQASQQPQQEYDCATATLVDPLPPTLKDIHKYRSAGSNKFKSTNGNR